ncbi:MAG: hypothetical protein WCB96_05745, partial [Candidatus Aminicenantales bacterium]
MIIQPTRKIFIIVPLLMLAAGGAIALATAVGPSKNGPAYSPACGGAASVVQDAIIIDHTCTDLASIPPEWIEQAKDRLRVSYGHTSHGSQPITGMQVLMDNASYAGLYDFITDGSVAAGKLSIADTEPEGDLGSPDRVTWSSLTRNYLKGAGGDRNVVIWSW